MKRPAAPDFITDLDIESSLQDMMKTIHTMEDRLLHEFAAEHPDYPDEVEIALVTEFKDGQVVVRLGVPSLEFGVGKMVRVINMGALRAGILIQDAQKAQND